MEPSEQKTAPVPAPIDGQEPPEGLFSDNTFDDFPLSPEVLEGIAARGYTRATPVQARCIPLAIEGKDLIVRSKTGTGKTAAFGIPVVEQVKGGKRKPQALVLAPTRELALQGAQEIEGLGEPKGVRVLAIYGGASMQKQIDALEAGVDVVVGTPGRIIDQMRRGHLDLSEVAHKVLDEADEMLSMGFFEDVCHILDACPKSSQTLLFSATVSPDIEELIENYASEPETVLLSGDEFSVEGIQNILYETRDDYPKPRNLLYLVEMEEPAAAIVFANTRDDTALVAAVLSRHGWQAEILNSDLSQKERERVMRRVKSGELRFMVATDLAARGIDISGLTHVINYSLPEDPAVYMHRVGRTGRIGRGGTAISLMGGKDLSTLSVLEKQYGVSFERRKLPDAEEARKHWTDRHIRELKSGMEGSVFEAFLPLVKDIGARPDGQFLLAYALKSYFERLRPQVKQERAEDARREERRESRDRDGGRGGRDGERREKRRGRDGDRDRSDRPRRSRDEASAEGVDAAPREDDGTRLFVSAGRTAGLDEEGVKTLVCELAGADPLTVVSVDVMDGFSFLKTRDADAARALLAASGKSFGEGTLTVEPAKSSGGGGKKRRRPARRRGPRGEG
jgi:ATP-dependent RNA helicase DeaD